MERTPITYTVEHLIEMIDRTGSRGRRIILSFANQRPEGQWPNDKKSLLIHSIIQDDIIPDIYILRDATETFQAGSTIDGVQRLSIAYTYVNEGFALSKNTPPVAMNGEIIEIAGKKFSQLSGEIQDILLNRELDCKLMFDCTDEDVIRTIQKLNNGRSMNALQHSIAGLKGDLACSIEKITKSQFFNNRIAYKPYEVKNDEGKRTVLLSLLVYTGGNYLQLNKGKYLDEFVQQMNQSWTVAQLEDYQNMFDMLDELLPNNDIVKPYLNRHNIPVLIMNLDKYRQLKEDGLITQEQYKSFLTQWFEQSINQEKYIQYLGKCVSDKSNVNGRIDVMEEALMKFLGLNTECEGSISQCA